ncbi:hypothetical protein B5K05_25970 [Rhizobium phaseoli]|nr:hypothetical protein RPHASCH2410_PD01070 [Rhizobium phaseoli Ch24-10]RDJ04182.1 hypothetical protein B5K04_25900 [Rhizobium phaseoli]RDJ06033.1 hypothetical protein B5K05_25970 [Rhizobium phaseoli]
MCQGEKRLKNQADGSRRSFTVRRFSGLLMASRLGASNAAWQAAAPLPPRFSVEIFHFKKRDLRFGATRLGPDLQGLARRHGQGMQKAIGLGKQ